MLDIIQSLTNKYSNVEVTTNIHKEMTSKGCVLLVWPELNKSQIVLRTKNKDKSIIEKIVEQYKDTEDKHKSIFANMLSKGIYTEEEAAIKICSSQPYL